MLDIIKLVSQAGTGTFYTTTKNKKTCPREKLLQRNTTEKHSMRKLAVLVLMFCLKIRRLNSG